MRKDLELKVLLSLVAHLQSRLQGVPCEGDTVHQTELVRPRLTELLTQHGVRQSEIQLDGNLPRVLGRLGRRLPKEFPVGVACESMLRKW